MSKDAKKNVLPHSQAKLDLFKSYLETYLPILSLAKGITKINLYDIFCGMGIYEDNKIGSPLIAINAINKTNDLFDLRGWKRKPISLNINDGEKDKIENVKNLLKDVSMNNCKINFFNLDADEMLEKVIVEINTRANTERNLVFIDPYGYSNISKDKIFGLLAKGYTEVVLFLPVMQMYRFSEVALTDVESKCYEDLRNFIKDFLNSKSDFESIFDFINAITKGLKFDNKYLCCSHYIERDKGNYYAVFFVTPHLYGLQKMLEVKWKEDPSRGKGFKKENWGLFEETRVDVNKKIQLNYLKGLLIDSLKKLDKGLSNVDLFFFVLSNEFLPVHINAIIRDLKEQKKIVTTDQNYIEKNFGNTTYINLDHYNKNDIKIFFKLK